MPSLTSSLALLLPAAAAVNFIDCPANITKNFTTALSGAQNLASGAVDALNLLGLDASTNTSLERDQVRTLYKKFFGDVGGEDSELPYVKGAFERAFDVLRNEKFEFHCDADPINLSPPCSEGAAAFVPYNMSDHVHLCPHALNNMSLPFTFSLQNLTGDALNDTLRPMAAFYSFLPRLVLHETMHLAAVASPREIKDIRLTESWDGFHQISCYWDFATLLNSVPGLASRNAENYASFALSIDLISRDPRLLYHESMVVKRPTSRKDREAMDCVLKKYVSDEEQEDDPACWEELGKLRHEAGVPDLTGNIARPSALTFTGSTWTTVRTMSSSTTMGSITADPSTTSTVAVRSGRTSEYDLSHMV